MYPGQQGGPDGYQNTANPTDRSPVWNLGMRDPGGYPGSAVSGGYPGTGGPSGFPQSQSNYSGGGFVGQPGGSFNQALIKPEVQQIFQQVDRDRSGRIDYAELQAALVNNQGKHYSESACKLMIRMFDQNNIGTIDIYEFQQLYDFINAWITMFQQFDRNQSGTIAESELNQALQLLGFNFSPQFIRFLVYKFDFESHSRITVDQFITLCVQIQRLTDSFMLRDVQRNGAITIRYEEFLFEALQCAP